ncbi:hypothetical protein Tco_1432644, partial [Tanacetum coccineum]
DEVDGGDSDGVEVVTAGGGGGFGGRGGAWRRVSMGIG